DPANRSELGAFGFNIPALVNAEGQLSAGHGRVLAAGSGHDSRPDNHARTYVRDSVRAFMIADNRLVENSEWDEQLLAQQLKGLFDLNFSVEVTGFEIGEIDVIMESLYRPGAARMTPVMQSPTSWPN